MTTNFKEELRQYVINNYQYDPAYGKEKKVFKKNFNKNKKSTIP